MSSPTPPIQSHIAVAAFPFSSHSAAVLSVTTALASIAPSSHFSFISTDCSLASLPPPILPNLSFIPISNGMHTDPSVPPNIQVQIGMFVTSFPENLREVLKKAEVATGCSVSCMMSDAFLWMSGDVARSIGVKWVPIWTGGPQSLLSHLHTDLIRKIIGVGDEAVKSYGNRKLDFVPGLSSHRACDLQDDIIGEAIDSPLATTLHQMSHRLLKSDVIVLNTIQGLNPTAESYLTEKFQNCFPVGPFQLLNSVDTKPTTDTYDCLSWLDQHEPATVAYVGFGTIVTIPPSELTSLANGLEASGVSFIWSLKENAQSLLPPGFIDRINETGKGKVVPWAPQRSVLAHKAVGVFVCHCGWNSVTESIAGGVPILARPFFGDHIVNARSISHVWKFGIILDRGIFTEEGVVKGLEVLLKEEEGRKMRDKARQLKDMANTALTRHGSSRENLKSLMKFVCGC